MARWTIIDLAAFTGRSGVGSMMGPWALRSNSHVHRRATLKAVSSSHSIAPSMRGLRWRTVVPSMSKMTMLGFGSDIRPRVKIFRGRVEGNARWCTRFAHSVIYFKFVAGDIL